MDDTFSAHEATRKRRRWGCTCGCLAFFFLVGILVIFLGWTLVRPQKAVARDYWMTPDTDGFGLIRLNPDDRGVSEFLNFVLTRFEESGAAEMTPEERDAVSNVLKVFRQFVGQFVHKEIPIYLRTDLARGTNEYVGVVQFRNAITAFVARMLLSSANVKSTERIHGLAIYGPRPREGVTTQTQRILGLSRQQLVISNSLDYTRTVLDPKKPRATDQTEAKLDQYIPDLGLDDPTQGEDFAAVALNADGRLSRWIDNFSRKAGASGLLDMIQRALNAQKIKLADVLAVKVSGDLASADKVSLAFTLYTRQPDTARKLADVLKAAMNEQLRPSSGSSLKIKHDAKSSGTNAVVTLEITGLKAWLHPTAPALPGLSTKGTTGGVEIQQEPDSQGGRL